MEDMVPAAGRVLRYWYGALASHCQSQLTDLLGLETSGPAEDPVDDRNWASAEVWSQPEPGHEATIVLPSGPRKSASVPRVRMGSTNLDQPASRKPGVIVSATFGCTRSRLVRSKASSSSGFI